MAKKITSGSVKYAGEAETLPLAVKKDPRFPSLSIGIPKEITFQETGFRLHLPQFSILCQTDIK